jgi:hypothetical protein
MSLGERSIKALLGDANEHQVKFQLVGRLANEGLEII